MVSQLLLEMDMLEGEGCGVVVMAATNTPQVRLDIGQNAWNEWNLTHSLMPRCWMRRSCVRADSTAASTLARPTNPSVTCVCRPVCFLVRSLVC